MSEWTQEEMHAAAIKNDPNLEVVNGNLQLKPPEQRVKRTHFFNDTPDGKSLARRIAACFGLSKRCREWRVALKTVQIIIAQRQSKEL